MDLFGTGVSEFSRQILLLVGGVVLLTITHPRLTLTTLLVTPVVVAVALGFGRRLRRATTGVQDQVAEAMGTAEESRRFSAMFADVVRSAVRRAMMRAQFFGVVAVPWQGLFARLGG